MFFDVSLAEWSLHNALQGGSLNHLDFPVVARSEFGLDAVEYVNQFFTSTTSGYLAQLKHRCEDHGVRSLLIMCDHEGELASSQRSTRMEAVESHYKWIDAAHYLGCHSIRVNCFGDGTKEGLMAAAAESLRKLAEFANPAGINIIVENHGGHTSDAKWLVSLMQSVAMTNVGTLPDFGNFCTRREQGDMWHSPCLEWYDRYQGVAELLPFAKGVSAKGMEFGSDGECIETDYSRMLPIVHAAGYRGYLGIEYEGPVLAERDGIRAIHALLRRYGDI
ncbi:MAG: sugar phosphate isomerase/epimerase [Cyclobacteriaceae bacterium]|nr:sugar phosphate isomerase/epimerase [Cyclobacteriaceae bacterium]